MSNNNAKLINLITGVKNGGFVTIEKAGEHKMLKTGNPLRDAKVEKRSRFQVRLGCNTQNLEDKAAKREAREPRQIGPLPWGEYVAEGVPVIAHKGSLYVRGYWEKALGSEYTVNGKPATPEQIAIIKQFTSKREMDKLAPLNIKFDNIKKLSGGGKVVEV